MNELISKLKEALAAAENEAELADSEALKQEDRADHLDDTLHTLVATVEKEIRRMPKGDVYTNIKSALENAASVDAAGEWSPAYQGKTAPSRHIENDGVWICYWITTAMPEFRKLLEYSEYGEIIYAVQDYSIKAAARFASDWESLPEGSEWKEHTQYWDYLPAWLEAEYQTMRVKK